MGGAASPLRLTADVVMRGGGIVAALARRESRGSHFRIDFPPTGADAGGRSVSSPAEAGIQCYSSTRNSEASPCSAAS